MQDITIIDKDFIEAHNNFHELTMLIKDAFKFDSIKAPLRHHHDFENSTDKKDATLLIMPAWSPGQELGVKLVTVNPHNKNHDLPSVQGIYLFFDAQTGVPKAMIDAKELTVKRTAATSALASSFLSKQDASSLLMIGTGALSTNLILAHSKVRPIKDVYVWGRNYNKALAVCEALKENDFKIYPIKHIEDVIDKVDIISCATLSKEPLVLGKFIRGGQHIDLVGSYKKDMREADDTLITKGNIFLDTLEAGLKESGDIYIPLQKGIIKESDIKADLFALCSQKNKGRIHPNEITIFKSVGHALEDLTAAKYFYAKQQNL